jgi:uncharacterized RDD family membrane protein YckC
MKYVDIITAQKVEISYPLATTMQRVFAFGIDFFIMGFAYLLVILAFIALELEDDSLEIIALIFAMPVIVFYSLISEILLNGQSLGKKVLQLRVVKLVGGEPAFFDYAIRWVFKPIDVWMSVGSIAVILVSSSPRNQRLGDMLAGTTVIKIRPDREYHLSEVEKILVRDNYKVTYPGVIQFSEQQMLLVKETYDKALQIKNPSHNEAFKVMVHRLIEQLELDRVDETREQFVRTLIRDYIYLTR